MFLEAASNTNRGDLVRSQHPTDSSHRRTYHVCGYRAAFYPAPSDPPAVHPIFPHGVRQLTMFADYRVPQVSPLLMLVYFRSNIPCCSFCNTSRSLPMNPPYSLSLTHTPRSSPGRSKSLLYGLAQFVRLSACENLSKCFALRKVEEVSRSVVCSSISFYGIPRSRWRAT